MAGLYPEAENNTQCCRGETARDAGGHWEWESRDDGDCVKLETFWEQSLEALQSIQPMRSTRRKPQSTQPIRKPDTTQPIRKPQTTQPIRQPQTTQPIRRLDLVDATFQRWRRIGESVGLSDDSEIASLLIQHYEDTKEGIPEPSGHCSSCHARLTLTCATCDLSPPLTRHFPPPITNGVSSRNDCGSSFPLASTLKQHRLIHSGERPFPCPHCEKTFTRSGDLTSHLRVHTGLRPFLCQDCGKRFASSSDLTKHKRTHTGDRPFQCPCCQKRFPFPHRLTAHMRSHTGDKPYLCTVCGAAFARASNLTVHFRIHTGDKPFECKECGKRFSDSGNLCKHRRTSHGGLGKKGERNSGGVVSAGSSSCVGLRAESVTVSQAANTNTSNSMEEEECASLSPYFSAAALGYYYQQ
ncbi:hypothetical protein ACOMHN_041471 [Nucella lapillus]